MDLVNASETTNEKWVREEGLDDGVKGAAGVVLLPLVGGFVEAVGDVRTDVDFYEGFFDEIGVIEIVVC